MKNFGYAVALILVVVFIAMMLANGADFDPTSKTIGIF